MADTYGGAEWEWMAEFDPKFKGLHAQLVNHLFEPGEDAELSAKTRAIIVSVVMALQKHRTAGKHMRHAISLGATVRELVEAMETASIPGGFTCLHFALPHLMQIKEELDAGRLVYDANETITERT